MTSRKLKVAAALTAGTFLASIGGSALAQSSDEMRKQIEDLQRQLQTLKERLDRQEAQPRPAAPAPASSMAPAAAPSGYSGSGLQAPADIPGAWNGWYAGATVGSRVQERIGVSASCRRFICAGVTIPLRIFTKCG